MKKYELTEELKEKMEKTKVKIKMEIEVEDIEDFSKFIDTVEKGVIKFSEETKANILKVEVKEK